MLDQAIQFTELAFIVTLLIPAVRTVFWVLIGDNTEDNTEEKQQEDSRQVTNICQPKPFPIKSHWTVKQLKTNLVQKGYAGLSKLRKNDLITLMSTELMTS